MLKSICLFYCVKNLTLNACLDMGPKTGILFFVKGLDGFKNSYHSLLNNVIPITTDDEVKVCSLFYEFLIFIYKVFFGCEASLLSHLYQALIRKNVKLFFFHLFVF